MLQDSFARIRRRSEDLCAPLSVEDFVPQPTEYASPPKWHLAHTSWFFEEMILKPSCDHYSRFDTDFEHLFNSYYQGIGTPAERAQRGLMTRPTVAQVYSYRAHVDRFMTDVIGNDPADEVKELVTLGLHHEQQHQELLITDLKLLLSFNPTHPVYAQGGSRVDDHNGESGWVDVPGGLYDIGHTGEDFSFDNEHGRHKVHLVDYRLSKSLVTNAEFLAFMEDGGYEDFRFWLDEGWSWVQGEQISHPKYWQQRDGQWHYFTLEGLKPVDPDAILAHVNYYEADAYARWAGKRLPTEFEWEAASGSIDWGTRWEWTSSAYGAYPGFKIGDGAVGEYNGKFMVNQMVLRGASTATSPGHSRATYRNFFHPHLRWQYSGVRLAE